MKKFLGLLLGVFGLSTLLNNKTEASLPAQSKLKRDPITQINISDLIPQGLDPRKSVAGILNLIGKAEANGNYNASFGNGVYGSANLTNMTLDEVRTYQEKLLKNQRDKGIPRKNTSSAVGKYQFIRKTFDSTRAALRFSGGTKFSPAVQDEFAYYQLKQAGWENFIGGQITLDNMMLKISKIWASFPKNMTGVSYYEGVANNMALVSPNEVTNVLNQARKA
jgi:muramidase (phage lysozyme)